MRRFFRPSFRRPFPVFFVPTFRYSVVNFRLDGDLVEYFPMKDLEIKTCSAFLLNFDLESVFVGAGEYIRAATKAKSRPSQN